MYYQIYDYDELCIIIAERIFDWEKKMKRKKGISQ